MNNRDDKIKKLARLNRRRNKIKFSMPLLKRIFGENFSEKEIEDYDVVIDTIEKYWSQLDDADKGLLISKNTEWNEVDYGSALLELNQILTKNSNLRVKLLWTHNDVGIISTQIKTILPYVNEIIHLDDNQFKIFYPEFDAGIYFCRHSYHWADKIVTYKWIYTAWGKFISDL